MNWDNLEVDDWINIEGGFVFYVDRYIDKVRVASKRLESVTMAKELMEHIKKYEKGIDEVQIIAVRKTDEDIFENFDEYWANVDIWIREGGDKMTAEQAIEVIKSNCYVLNLLNLDRTTLINTALDMAVEALEKYKKEVK